MVTVDRVIALCDRHRIPLLASCPAASVVLGEGANAVCCKGILEKGSKMCEVVVKKVRSERRLASDHMLGELLEEAVLLARVSGLRGLPRLHGLVLNPPTLVTSYDGSVTLSDVLGRRPPQVRDCHLVHAAVDVCRALAGLHHRGVGHNDLKSNNVVVRLEEGGHLSVCIIDLGNSTPLGKPVFSPGKVRWEDYQYLAPELVMGGPSSASCDVYSLGYMLRCVSKRLDDTTVACQLREIGLRAAVLNPQQRASLSEVMEALEQLTSEP